MSRKLLMGLVLIAGLVGVAACHYTPEQQADWVASKISSKLDLTAEQKAKLDLVKNALLDIRKAHEAERAKHMDEVKQMILSDHLDSAKVKALMSQRQKFMDENFDSVFPKIADFHASLTPEQKKKAVDLIEKFSNHWD